MKKIASLILMACSIAAFGQKEPKSPIVYGDIPMEDMKMTVYDKDSTASAVILVDYGVAYLSSLVNNKTGRAAAGQVLINFDKHVRIKILTTDGLKYANSRILLSINGDDVVQRFEASSYNLENGNIIETKISKDGIFNEKFNRYLAQQKFTIPNAKVGSVIEYSYRKVSRAALNFPNWNFQSTIPTRFSEYWAMMPEMFIYERYMQGYITLSTVDQRKINYFQKDVNAYHYLATDVPAYKPEPFMTEGDDYISKINFALSRINFPGYQAEIMGSWAKLNETLLASEYFGKVIEGSGFLKEMTDQITGGITDPLKKISAISDYIKQNVEYDGYENFLAFPSKKVLEKKKGSAGDINIMFASMLQKAGFETDMVVLSTRDHGFVRQQFPMERQFNYVVCAVRVGDKILLVDATEKYLPYDVLPARCLNGQGLVISAKNHSWIDITTKAKSKTIVNADMILDPAGELKGKIQYTRDGFDAANMRRSYMKDGEEKYVSEFSKTKQWQIAKSDFQDMKDLGKTAKEIHEISIGEHTSVAGDVIYLNPFVASQIVENPFKAETRIYPVDFGTALDKTYMLKVVVPEGYAVDELPKSKIMTLPGNAGKYLYNATMVGNSVSITSSLQINKGLFIQDEYPILKEFYNQIVAKQAEQIVLKKK